MFSGEFQHASTAVYQNYVRTATDNPGKTCQQTRTTSSDKTMLSEASWPASEGKHSGSTKAPPHQYLPTQAKPTSKFLQYPTIQEIQKVETKAIQTSLRCTLPWHLVNLEIENLNNLNNSVHIERITKFVHLRKTRCFPAAPTCCRRRSNPTLPPSSSPPEVGYICTHLSRDASSQRCTASGSHEISRPVFVGSTQTMMGTTCTVSREGSASEYV